MEYWPRPYHTEDESAICKLNVLYINKSVSRETGLAPDESLEQKVNYGGLLLQALLEYWPRPYNTEDESDLEQVNWLALMA